MRDAVTLEDYSSAAQIRDRLRAAREEARPSPPPPSCTTPPHPIRAAAPPQPRAPPGAAREPCAPWRSSPASRARAARRPQDAVARELAALRAAIEQEDFDQVPYAQHARRRRLARTRLLDPRSASPLSGTAMPCPISTGWTCVKRDTRRVRLVRSEGRGVST